MPLSPFALISDQMQNNKLPGSSMQHQALHAAIIFSDWVRCYQLAYIPRK